MPAGISTIYGYVKDEAGNVGKCQVEVKNDNIVPVQVVNYGYQVYPKEDMTSTNNGLINIDNFLNEYGNIKGIKIYFNNNTNTITNSTVKSGSTILATRTIAAGVNYMEYTFTNGTYNNLSIDLKSAANVSKVTKVEVIKDQITTGFYTNSDVTIYVNSKDAMSGNGYYSYDGGTTWVNNSSNTFSSNSSLTVLTKDRAGNVSEPTIVNIKNIDKMFPSCSLMTSEVPSGGALVSNNTEVKFKTHLDAAMTGSYTMSGVRDYSFNPSGIGDPKTKIHVNTSTAETRYTGYIIDKAGNKSSCSVSVDVDTTKPTVILTATKKDAGTTVNSGSWSNEGLNFIFTKGTTGTGNYTIKYCMNESGSCTPNLVATNGVAVSSYNTKNGIYYISYVITSDSGLSSSVETYKAMVDTTKPTVNLTATQKGTTTAIASGVTSQFGLDFTLTKGIVGESGYTIKYCQDYSNTCNPETVVVSGELITAHENLVGTYYIRYMIETGAGNTSLIVPGNTPEYYKAVVQPAETSCKISYSNSVLTLNYTGTDIKGYGLVKSSVSGGKYLTNSVKSLPVSGTDYYLGYVKDGSGGEAKCTLYVDSSLYDAEIKSCASRSNGDLDSSGHIPTTTCYKISYNCGSGTCNEISRDSVSQTYCKDSSHDVYKYDSSNNLISKIIYRNGSTYELVTSHSSIKYCVPEVEIDCNGEEDAGKHYIASCTLKHTCPDSSLTLGDDGLYCYKESYVDSSTPNVVVTAVKVSNGTEAASDTWSGDYLNYYFTRGATGDSGGYTIRYCMDRTNKCYPTIDATNGVAVKDFAKEKGKYYIRYRIETASGKISDIKTYVAKVDVDKPTCTISVSSPNIVLNHADEESGVKSYGLNLGSSTINGKDSVAVAAGTYYGYVIDNVGNSSTCKLETVVKSTEEVGCTVTNAHCVTGGYWTYTNCETGETTNSFYEGGNCDNFVPTGCSTGLSVTCSVQSRCGSFECSDGNTYSSGEECVRKKCGDRHYCRNGYADIPGTDYCYLR